MVISAYQVNNVLRVYGDQLRQTRISNRPKNTDTTTPDKISISEGARRKSIIDMVASDIVDKITKNGPNGNIEEEVLKKLENEFGGNLTVSRTGPSELIFKEIDENGETINSLSIEDSKFLSYKLNEITMDAIDKNMVKKSES
jgi:hypothetical protein